MKTVCEYIERKTLLYKTGVEYGDYTINHLQGCSHGCRYPCYAFLKQTLRWSMLNKRLPPIH